MHPKTLKRALYRRKRLEGRRSAYIDDLDIPPLAQTIPVPCLPFLRRLLPPLLHAEPSLRPPLRLSLPATRSPSLPLSPLLSSASWRALHLPLSVAYSPPAALRLASSHPLSPDPTSQNVKFPCPMSREVVPVNDTAVTGFRYRYTHTHTM